MPRLDFDRNNPPENGDWVGNNAAFTCPLCERVFIVTTMPSIHDGQRTCPACARSTPFVTGGRLNPAAQAFITWEDAV